MLVVSYSNSRYYSDTNCNHNLDSASVVIKADHVNNTWVGAQNLKKPKDSRHRRQNLRKSLQPTAIM